MKKLLIIVTLFLMLGCSIKIETGRVYDKKYIPAKRKHYTERVGKITVSKSKKIPECYKLYVSDVTNPEKIGYKCVSKSEFDSTQFGDIITNNIKRGVY